MRPDEAATIRLTPRGVTMVLGGATVALLALNVFVLVMWHVFDHGQLLGMTWMLYFDGEVNIPTLYSSVLLVFAAALLGVLADRSRSRSLGEAVAWGLLTIALLYAALDESTMLHEELVKPWRQIIGRQRLLHYAWVVPYAGAFILIGSLYLPLWWRQRPAFRIGTAAATAIYLGGAIGMEMVAGVYLSGGGDRFTPTFAVLTSIEETLEMCGCIVLIRTLVAELAAREREVRS